MILLKVIKTQIDLIMSQFKNKKIIQRAKLSQNTVRVFINDIFENNQKKMSYDEREALWAHINFTLQTLN